MSITLGVAAVDDGSSAAASTLVLTLAGTTIGRSIVLGLAWDSTTTISSITCTGESNLTLIGSPQFLSGNGYTQLAYLGLNTTGGTKTITVTYTGSTSRRNGAALELIGGKTGSLLDNFGSTSGGPSADWSINITTGTNNAAILAVTTHGNGPRTTPGGGYTDLQFGGVWGLHSAEYLLDASTAGSKTVNFTHTSTSWGISVASFNSADPPITPTAGSLALTGYTPTVMPSVGTYPVAGSVLLAGYAPGVSIPGIPSTLTGSLALSGAAPVVGLGIVPTAGAVLGTGVAPFPATTSLRTPTAGALALAGVAPSTNVGQYATPISGALVLASVNMAINYPAALQAITGTGILRTSTNIVGAATMEAITGTGIGTSPNLGSGAASLEPIDGVGYSAAYGAASLRPLTATGIASYVMTGSALMQPIAAVSNSGAASLERITGYGIGAATLTNTFSTVVMNARNKGITEYQNYGFNSYARIGTSYYGASSTGLYLLDGDDDNGTNIDWVVRTSQLDDKSVMLKRLPEIVFGLRSSGPIRVRVYKDDSRYYDYMLPAIKVNTIHQSRVTPGKGMRSRYYAVELQGVSNSVIELDSIQINMTKTTRRVG